MLSVPQLPQNVLEDELEVMFIAETFHKSEPIREKPSKNSIPRVWIREKRKTKAYDGVQIKLEPQPRKSLNSLFSELQTLRAQAGVKFETDPIEGYGEDIEDDDDDDDDYEDIDDDTMTEENILGSKGLKRSTKRNVGINLAKKLKKRAIANRLGIAYNAAKSKKLRDLRNRMGTTKSWSEKFGQLLASKKLLYLPLLFRKYRMGPIKTREELDVEIDLYMSEVKKSKTELGLEQIKTAANGDTGLNGLKVIKFGGFGGPGWRKKQIKPEKEEPVDRDTLDMELDQYMSSKDKLLINGNHNPEASSVDKEALDMELEEYMATVNKKKANTNGSHKLCNGFES